MSCISSHPTRVRSRGSLKSLTPCPCLIKAFHPDPMHHVSFSKIARSHFWSAFCHVNKLLSFAKSFCPVLEFLLILWQGPRSDWGLPWVPPSITFIITLWDSNETEKSHQYWVIVFGTYFSSTRQLTCDFQSLGG